MAKSPTRIPSRDYSQIDLINRQIGSLVRIPVDLSLVVGILIQFLVEMGPWPCPIWTHFCALIVDVSPRA